MEQKINDAIKKAMLGQDEVGLRTLRAIKASILLFKTSAEFTGVINADNEMKILQKLAKQRQDSIAIYEQQNRQDLLVKEKEELKIIQTYLPDQLDEAEILSVINQIKQETNITSILEIGKLIGLVNKKLAGQADGKTIAALVKQTLS